MEVPPSAEGQTTVIDFLAELLNVRVCVTTSDLGSRNKMQRERTFFWWVRGGGGGRQSNDVGCTHTGCVGFLRRQWGRGVGENGTFDLERLGSHLWCDTGRGEMGGN